MEKHPQPNDASTPAGSIIPYYFQGNNEPWYYNDIHETGVYSAFSSAAVKNDPFELSTDPVDPILQA